MNQKLINFGIINIDKPSGPTSFTISDFIRKKLQVNKTSHMGTLDPKVTGVLPITLGKACRLAGYIIGHDKTYIGILHTHKEQEQKHLQELINKHFTGTIKQTPPHKSAVKREIRERTVHYFNILETSEDKRNFLFETKVEGGTYIRKLCSDLGDMIGGAHMEELRRTQAGLFNEETSITLQQFDEAKKEYDKGNTQALEQHITPAERIIPKLMKTIQIKKEAKEALYHGKPLLKKDVKEKKNIEKGERFAAFIQEELIGIYLKTNEKDIYGRAEFVYV